MDDWGRYQSEGYHHEVSRTPARWQNRKRHPGSWQATVPSWEKEFCSSVGSMPWQKFLAAKRFLPTCSNVLQWNDSAGEEAFHNAKNRFWAKINGLPCDISVPDPDIYIDEIDWNSTIDPELVLDLDREPDLPNESEKDGKPATFGNVILLNQPVIPSGWGDVEENRSSGQCDRNADNSDNPWVLSSSQGNGYSGANLWRDNQWEKNPKDSENTKSRRDGNCWGTWDWNDMNRESSGNMSRYKTSRFHGGYRNGKGRKRVNFVYDRPPVDKKPLGQRQWNSFHTCQPVGHHQSVEVENPWNWKKPVI